MNDPHVKALHYRVKVGKDIDYDNAPSVDESTDEFDLSINGDIAIFEMKKHYPAADEAKEVVDEYLRAWDILIGLEHDPDDLRFVFDRPDVIDRSPHENDKNIVNLHAHIAASTTTSNVHLNVSREQYPPFPQNFIASPDAETMYLRYKAYRQNREKLTHMTYMCFTVLKTSAGGLEKAANQYCISSKVLKKLSELSTIRGGATEARKYPVDGTFTPLSLEEKEWIVSVIKASIRRVGEYEYARSTGAELKKITMEDFPKI